MNNNVLNSFEALSLLMKTIITKINIPILIPAIALTELCTKKTAANSLARGFKIRRFC